MADDGATLKPDALSGVVPHFYYDLIGRIAPGAYLLLGGCWIIQNRPDVGAALGTSLSFTGMLIVALAAYAISFIIGPCSYRLWDWSCRFGETDVTREVASVLAKNQIDLPVGKGRELHRSIVSRSELCAYRLWLRAPRLAIMCSRWDAETFAARQFGMATVILAAITVWMRMTGKPNAEDKIILCLATLIIFLSYDQFRYLRRKAVFARFMMLACVPSEAAQAAKA